MRERVLGIVGGTGPESTIAYYRATLDEWRLGDPGTFPRVIINSLDGATLWSFVEAGDDHTVADVLGAAVGAVAAAGAGMAIIASNTLHRVFNATMQRSAIPMISIVDATAEAITGAGVRHPLLLGTRQVTESDLYLAPLRAAGIEPVVGTSPEREYVHAKYVEELVHGTFADETRQAILETVRAAARRARVDAIVLAGTELGLLLPLDEYDGVPVIDSTRAHVRAATRWLRGATGPD